ncbi:hypothetical protein NAPIS_ORF02771 [Vairimorpha apis BRL 01]|uniref:Uncharacterized protein n=1 Tax=Vairimorpha apis BRL 01 TaxID=1037528 RepID=T0MF11_9MICR|nr:hypothetical protein NAPIS_ORF02771 [Vairimorpha apis BRL 01]
MEYINKVYGNINKLEINKVENSNINKKEKIKDLTYEMDILKQRKYNKEIQIDKDNLSGEVINNNRESTTNRDNYNNIDSSINNDIYNNRDNTTNRERIK